MPRLLKKSIRDLFKDKRRATLSLLAILIGTMTFAIAAFSYAIIPREIISVYDGINPASATIIVNKVDDMLIELTENFEDIAVFEQRAFYTLRAQVGENQWMPLELYSAINFEALQVNKITSEQGSFQPGLGEMLIEHDALGVARAGIGDTLTISLPNGDTRELSITGIVADMAPHPASVHRTIYAYVSNETLLDLGFVNNKIEFIVTGERYDKERILAVSNEYIRLLEQNGYTVLSLYVSDTPGVRMFLDTYRSAMILFQIFSVVSFLFGCMIMSSLISSIISGQTRQIGILKAIGASTGKITVSYMAAFFCMVLFTAAISIILSTLFTETVVSALMGLGNMYPSDTSVPLHLYIVYGVLSLIVPMAIAYFPIRRGVSISVKDALNDYGLNADGQVMKLPEPNFLSRPILLSLRNAIRRRRRFLLNVAILSMTGAFFVMVLTTMLSLQTTIADNLNMWKFDYMFLTNTTFTDDELSEIVEGIPNVRNHEDWGSSRGMIMNDNGEFTSTYRLLSPPDNSTMIEPQILEGRWISPHDTNQVVVGHSFFENEPDYQVGDTLAVQIGNQLHEFVIVGSIRDFGLTTIYMNESTFNEHVPSRSRISNVKLSLDMTGLARRVYRDTNAALEAQDILIMQTMSKSDLSAIASGHFSVTIQTFLIVTSLLVILSGFGLAATMNAQTSERTKEIGIMKAMGAGKRQIMRIVTAESIFISLISWGVSLVIGIPLGIAGVYVFGNMVLETPLEFSAVSLLTSFIIWLIFTLAIGYFASRSCAKRAAKMSVKSSLAFE